MIVTPVHGSHLSQHSAQVRGRRLSNLHQKVTIVMFDNLQGSRFLRSSTYCLYHGHHRSVFSWQQSLKQSLTNHHCLIFHLFLPIVHPQWPTLAYFSLPYRPCITKNTMANLLHTSQANEEQKRLEPGTSEWNISFQRE